MGNNTTGLEEILSNIQKEISSVRRKGNTGIKKAGLLVLRKSQKKVPVDFGFLKSSGFMKMTGNRQTGPRATIGYTEEYALYVHENLEARHGPDRAPFRRGKTTIGPGGIGQEAKFLENAIKENEDKIVAIIKSEQI